MIFFSRFTVSSLFVSLSSSLQVVIPLLTCASAPRNYCHVWQRSCREGWNEKQLGCNLILITRRGSKIYVFFRYLLVITVCFHSTVWPQAALCKLLAAVLLYLLSIFNIQYSVANKQTAEQHKNINNHQLPQLQYPYFQYVQEKQA